jgi:cation diffusion facilitator family transporter
MSGPSLTRFAGLATLAAAAVIAMKLFAWHVTGSVGLLSDAVESVANLAGALMAWVMLWWAARPPDEEHAYGHSKAEYFSSGFEGGLILIAGLGILWAAIPRLVHPQPLQEVLLGLMVAGVATVLNGGVAWILLRAGRQHGSITLEAGGRHLLADVWTSVAVIVGVAVVSVTGWNRMDALLAMGVGIHILFTGWRLMQRSAWGLLDTAIPEEDRREIHRILARYEEQGILFHALRSRRAGRRSFVSMHVLVPGDWTVQRAHDLAETIEGELQEAVPGSQVFTHLEPVEDPVSFQDTKVPPFPTRPRS